MTEDLGRKLDNTLKILLALLVLTAIIFLILLMNCFYSGRCFHRPGPVSSVPGIVGVPAQTASTSLPGPGSPGSKTEPGPSPSKIVQPALHQPPPLTETGGAAQAQVAVFIDWASRSRPEEQEDGRRALAAAGANDDIAKAFFDAAMAAEQTDHTRALVALSLLGEMRNRAAEQWLRDLLARPMPRTGTVVDGEIKEQTALGKLQAKAIDGLAFLKTESATNAVLRAIAEHPSRIVRAEAIEAYLWNNGDSREARETLRRYVRKGEEIFLDRVRRQRGESAESFNRKLAIFLRTYPQAVPPEPVQHREKPVRNFPVVLPPAR